VRILALDPATQCGWALGEGRELVASGTWDFSTRRDESTGMKLLRLESKLVETHKAGLDLVVFEAARNAMPKMQGALVHQAKLQAIIERYVQRHDIAARGYSPSEIKLFATGKGNAGKPAVIAAAKARFGYHGDDDNEADAICLLHLAIQEYGS
jgi:crossover junction endodeoxyribonuclease RuvC